MSHLKETKEYLASLYITDIVGKFHLNDIDNSTILPYMEGAAALSL